MDGERISLRLESEDLMILDDFIESHPEYSNRSNLARVAIREFIENSGKSNNRAAPTSEYEISVVLPEAMYKIIANLISKGIFKSMEDGVVQCVRNEYSEYMKNVKETTLKNMEEDSPITLIDK